MSKHWPVALFVAQDDNCPVFEYMFDGKNEKDLSTIINVIQRLSRVGNNLIETNMAKRIDWPICELRKDRHRIFYAQDKEGVFILLFAFQKETQKTPPRFIEQAKQNYEEYLKFKKRQEFSLPSEI